MRLENYPYLRKVLHVLDGFLICHPSRAKLRLILSLLLVWLYIWFCNILFGANTALALAETIHNSSKILGSVPQPFIAFLLVLFFPIAGLKFVIIPVSAAAMALVGGARYLQFLYKFPSLQSSLKYLCAVLFGFFYPKLLIEDGNAIPEDPENWLTRIGGPGYLTIQPGFAVILERLESPSRILSAGQHYITRFEKIVDVIDLKDQVINLPESQAMTKDRIVMSVKGVFFRYRIASTARMEARNSRLNLEPYPFSVEAVRNLHYNRPVAVDGLSRWETVVQEMVSGEITDTINENNFSSLAIYNPSGVDAREMISNRIRSPGFRNKLRRIGTKIVWFDVGNIGLSEEYKIEPIINSWRASWMSKIAATKALGEAQRTSLQEIGKAEAQAEILKTVVEVITDQNLTKDTSSEESLALVISRLEQLFDSISKSSQGETI
jgi:hypothetical protein